MEKRKTEKVIDRRFPLEQTAAALVQLNGIDLSVSEKTL